EGARLVLRHALFHQERVGAQIHELATLNDALDDLVQLLVQKRLAAGDRYDRRAAFVDRAKRVLDRHALLQNLVRVIDLAAAGAGEIAPEQRLEHQHERIALTTGETLPHDVAADHHLLQKWNTHDYRPCPMLPRVSTSRSSTGTRN